MKIKALLSAVALLIPLYSVADDTEIFYYSLDGEDQTEYQPNVLFIFDTSGSMNDEVTTMEAYNPSTDYGVTAGDTDYLYIYNLNYDYITRVHNTQNRCPSMISHVTANTSNPVFTQKAVYRRNDGRYRNPCNSGGSCEYTPGPTGERYYCEMDSSNLLNWNKDSRRSYYHVSPNYHHYLQSDSIGERKKADIMKDAAVDMINEFNGINIGMMRFHGRRHADDTNKSGEGGYAISEFLDISNSDNKAALQAKIMGMYISGSTPLAETLWEAKLFFQGRSTHYDDGYAPSTVVDGDDDYITPMVHACQENHVVYLSDGMPTSDSGRDSSISALGPNCSHDSGTSSSNTCLDELAYWMHRNDLSGLTGQQNVTVHTIGFDIDMELLQAAASKGGGRYFTANNYTDLKIAFNSIIVDILDRKGNFVSPSVAVNAFNKLQSRNELYYALFQPEDSQRWPGNLKRYQIEPDGTITDLDGQDAIDPNTGFFSPASRSWWSSTDDGDDVDQGGAAEQLSATRRVYTHTSGATPNNTNLNSSANYLTDGNTAVTTAMMGADSATERSELINWGTGFDTEGINSLGDSNNFFADVLHNRPVVINYGGTQSNPDSTLFVATNQGYLSAIDIRDGSEYFSFVPPELLPNIKSYYDNAGAVNNKVYGLDGYTNVWYQESPADADQTIEAGDGDFVYIYQGMRRGGRNYYALNATSRSNPVYKWKIEGGVGDFVDLGQTWSSMRRGKVKINCSGGSCSDRDVLFFTGGYNPDEDDSTTPIASTLGAAIYMVDALTGQLLWSAGHSGASNPHDLKLADMKHSFPASPVISDLDADGYIDILFAIDITGQVFRFDFADTPASAGAFATGGRIAKLGDNDTSPGNDEANYLRFYNQPSVAYFNKRGYPPYFTISIGSGYRAHPRDEAVTDAIFVIYEYDVFQPPQDGNGNVSYETTFKADLANANSSAADQLTNGNGWYRTFTNGEKVLNEVLTYNGQILFSTYLPHGGGTNVCNVNTGGNRSYILNARTGLSELLDVNNNIIEYEDLTQSGIAPGVNLIQVADGVDTDGDGVDDDFSGSKLVRCIGRQCQEYTAPTSPVKKIYWREN